MNILPESTVRLTAAPQTISSRTPRQNSDLNIRNFYCLLPATTRRLGVPQETLATRVWAFNIQPTKLHNKHEAILALDVVLCADRTGPWQDVYFYPCPMPFSGKEYRTAPDHHSIPSRLLCFFAVQCSPEAVPDGTSLPLSQYRRSIRGPEHSAQQAQWALSAPRLQ